MDFNERVEQARRYLITVIQETAPLPYAERDKRLLELVGDAYVSRGISLKVAEAALSRISWESFGFQAESFWGEDYLELTAELINDILSHIDGSESVTHLDKK